MGFLCSFIILHRHIDQMVNGARAWCVTHNKEKMKRFLQLNSLTDDRMGRIIEKLFVEIKFIS